MKNIFKHNKEEEVLKEINIVIPTKWEEVNLKQYRELEKIKLKDIKDISSMLPILTNLSKEEIYQLPLDSINTLLGHIQFLNFQFDTKAKSNIIINNKEYLINYKDKLKFGEYVQINSLLDNKDINYAAILAILVRMKDEEFNDDFIANTLQDRIDMYDSQPITEIMPLISFFLNLWVQLEKCSQDYLMEAKQGINQYVTDIESSLNVMGLKKHYMIWQKIKLKRLKKLINNI